MNYILLTAISSAAGTFSLSLVYVYLYVLYRERHIGLWALSWIIFLLRNILFDFGVLQWKHSLWEFNLYQLLFNASGIVFVWGIYLFNNRKIHKGWLYGVVLAVVITALLGLLPVPPLYKLLPTAWYGGVVLLWIGIFFLFHMEGSGIGQQVTGYAFFLWGALTLIFPLFPRWMIWIVPLAGLLRVTIAAGTIIVYFEKTRQDLINKELPYRLFAENAADIIYRFKVVPAPIFEYISPAVLTVTGYDVEEFYREGSLFGTLLHPFELPPTDEAVSPRIFSILRKDGVAIWVEQTVTYIRDEGGQVTAVEGIVRDITSRRNLENIAERADKMNVVGQMAVSVAHEIRNPLTTVRGYLQFLAYKKGDKALESCYEILIEELDRANDIISEYLLLAKEKRAKLQHCSLNKVIYAIYPLLETLATADKAAIRIQLEPVPDILLDENEIRQLLLNLVRNAIEAMAHKGGLVQIRTYREAEQIILAISDNGPGIPAHMVEQLGTPFLTTKDTGTGLGLSICYRIVHRHGAVMKVKTGPAGTEFLIYFKLPV